LVFSYEKFRGPNHFFFFAPPGFFPAGFFATGFFFAAAGFLAAGFLAPADLLLVPPFLGFCA
jgi:hypothetical protein